MISVIIPMFNAEQTIRRALDSVLYQNWDGKFEIIIINDGSTDGSRQTVERYIAEHPNGAFQLIEQENKGVSHARNRGMEQAKGDFIALLDADDEWLPDKTHIQMHFFELNKSIDFLASRRNNKKLLFPYLGDSALIKVTFRKLLLRNEITIPSVIFKRKILGNAGCFPEGQNHAEDVDFYLRVSENNTMYIVNQSLVVAGAGKRSFGESGLSSNLKEMATGYRKNLDRLYHSKRITWLEWGFYRAFYKMKYAFLKTRNASLKARK